MPLETEPTTGGEPRTRVGMPLWFWALTATLAVIVLGVAVIGRETDGATLRAMSASESMSDEQARAVAENTVRVWVRERNEQHLANLEALSCPDVEGGALLRELDHVRNRDQTRDHSVVATGQLTRSGPDWKLITIFNDGGAVFELRIVDGALRVCQFDSAPIP